MMNAKIISVLIIFLFGTISCDTSLKESNFKKVEDIYNPVHSAEQITEDLEFAFSNRETVIIENIFTEWQKTVKPNTVEFINQNDTIAAIYEVFSSFYNPNEIHKLGDWKLDRELNSKCKYVVVQNKILYSILNSNKIDKIDWINSRKRLISNFRPQLDLIPNNVLYLTDEYEESFNDFLGNEIVITKEERVITSEHLNESKEKYEFIKDYIPLLLEQKLNFWHFETYPYVNRIFFNKTITRAKIDFSVGSQFGIAILEKKGKNWIITENKISMR